MGRIAIRREQSTKPRSNDELTTTTVARPRVISEHDDGLHFIAVRSDFTGFQHVHGDLGEDGVCETELDLTPGRGAPSPTTPQGVRHST